MILDLREVLLHGRTAGLRRGMTAAEVREMLGPPDAEGGATRKRRRPRVLKYGDLELHLDDRDGLHLLFADSFEVPRGGGALEVRPWILSGRLTMEQAEEQLPGATRGNDLLLRTALGATLHFEPQPDGRATLSAIAAPPHP